MRNLLSILLVAVFMLLGGMETVHAALANENNPHVMCVPLGSPSADATVLAGEAGGKSLYVLSVSLLNAASISASDTDYVQLELRKGATVVAELDSRAAHENGIAANAVEALNVVSAQRTVASGSVLSVVYNETDSGTAVALTGAVLCMHYAVK